MTNGGRIFPGCRVSGNHGDLVRHPDANRKRRMRSEVVGTVIKAIGQHKWEVLFDYNNKTKTVTSKLLKVVDNDIGIPLHEQTKLQEVSNCCFNLFFTILTVNC